MPIDPQTAAAVINTAGQVGGSALNAFGSLLQNAGNRKFSKKMYKRMRQDALADWNMQNEYNSPRAQMQRYQEAGLNPHLIYGQSQEAGSVRSTDFQKPEQYPVRPGEGIQAGGSMFMDIYDLNYKKAQTDNLTAMNTKILMDTMEKQIDIESKNLTLDQRKELDKYARNLYEQNPMLWKWNEEMRGIAARYSLSEMQHSELMQRIRHNEQKHPGNMKIQAQTLENMLQQNVKSKQEVSHLKSQIQNMLKDGRLKELDIQLKESGIQPGDPAWQRLIIRAINGEGVFKSKSKGYGVFRDKKYLELVQK